MADELHFLRAAMIYAILFLVILLGGALGAFLLWVPMMSVLTVSAIFAGLAVFFSLGICLGAYGVSESGELRSSFSRTFVPAGFERLRPPKTEAFEQPPANRTFGPARELQHRA